MTARDPHAASYEQLPYDSNPFFESHPGRLATIAYLSGLEPPDLESCRVLELGCAAGGNLIPAAEALPNASFVGVDLAPNQIADGMGVIDALGMKNVRLEAMSLTDIPADFGQFDYIIAHGLYSWVPPEVQGRILEICKAHLSPKGVAYVSYNTYPGWRMRGVMRDLILYGLEAEPAGIDLRSRLAKGRAFTEMILAAAADDDSSYHRVLNNEAGMVLKAPDAYIAHEYLEQWHEPIYFRDFVARAAHHGLTYLADAKFNRGIHQVESRLRQQRPELLGDRIRFEQCVDFAFGRQFRRSLLCHAGQSINPAMDPLRLMRCHLTTNVFPTKMPVDMQSNVEVIFQGADGGTLTTTDPILKSSITDLAMIFPMSVPFDALLKNQSRERLAESLLTLLASGSIEADLMPPAFVTRISECPAASPLARRQAAMRRPIHNRRHRTVRSFNDLDRALLKLLDGTRDRAALRTAMISMDAAVSDDALQESLKRLAMNAVLIS